MGYTSKKNFLVTQEATEPKYVTQLKLFLGLDIYYEKFVKNSAVVLHH